MQRLIQLFQDEDPSEQINTSLQILAEIHQGQEEAQEDWLLSLDLAYHRVQELHTTGQIDETLHKYWHSTINGQYNTVKEGLANAQGLKARNRAYDTRVLRSWGVTPDAILDQEFCGDKPLGKSLRGVLAELAPSGCSLARAQGLIKEAINLRVASPRQGVSSTRLMILSDVKSVWNHLKESQSVTSRTRKRKRNAAPDRAYRSNDISTTHLKTQSRRQDGSPSPEENAPVDSAWGDLSIEQGRHRPSSLSDNLEFPDLSNSTLSAPRIHPPLVAPRPDVHENSEVIHLPIHITDSTPQSSSTVNAPCSTTGNRMQSMESPLFQLPIPMQDPSLDPTDSISTLEPSLMNASRHMQDAFVCFMEARDQRQTTLAKNLEPALAAAELNGNRCIVILQAKRAERDIAAAAASSHSKVCRDQEQFSDPEVLRLLQLIAARVEQLKDELARCEEVVDMHEERMVVAAADIGKKRRQEESRYRDLQSATRAFEEVQAQADMVAQHKTTMDALISLPANSGTPLTTS
ncbi:MAG: hypothetical protein Q9222_002212 [Ikaeria aurantiellina]